MKKFFVLVTFLLFNSLLFSATSEVWMRIYQSDGVTALATYVSVYEVTGGNPGAKFYTGATSFSSMSGNNSTNAFLDFNDSQNSDSPFAPLYWGKSYIIKIQNQYVKISIAEKNVVPAPQGIGGTQDSPDIIITYIAGGSISVQTSPHVSVFASGPVANYSVVVKNSFSGGALKIDNETYSSVNNSGVSKSFENITYPHNITAIDNQARSSDQAKMKFVEWKRNQGGSSSDLTRDLEKQSGTFKAFFNAYYNQIFQNNFIGIGNKGYISVNYSNVSMPQQETGLYKQGESVRISAPTQVYNGIEYSFSSWSDGHTVFARDIPVSANNQSYTANYTGRPSNNGRNMAFNYSDPYGTNIKIYWTDNVNPNVTQYEIWRHPKNGTPVKIATVGRGVQFYEDSQYKRTANSNSTTLLFYDVRGVYSVEGTKANDQYQSCYGEGSPQMQFENKDEEQIVAAPQISLLKEEIKENSIRNYPNPFNPTTKVSYTIKEAGQVEVAVYDMLGKQIRKLVSTVKEPGTYVTNFDGSNLSSGIYILSMQINNERITKKIILVK